MVVFLSKDFNKCYFVCYNFDEFYIVQFNRWKNEFPMALKPVKSENVKWTTEQPIWYAHDFFSWYNIIGITYSLQCISVHS